jgi:serine/threonine-protein kinase
MLGKGGTCAVYRAWDTRLQRYVAIKRLEPPLSQDARARARFDREGRAIARISHPNIVSLIDQGSSEEEHYLVFEYVEGRSLKDEVASHGPLRPADAGRVAGQIAAGLALVHLAGIVHRDVKPQNILLDAEGRAKLTDFGIAISPDWTRVTRVGAVIGSSRYMSPEQIQNRSVDGRSDIYALGVVFYEMLTGRPPFDGTSIAEIGRKHLQESPTPLSEIRQDLPPGLERVVMRCLEKDPNNRFQTMDELLGALVGLGVYKPERTPTRGLLGAFRPASAAPDDTLGGSGEWVPPPDARLEPPADLRRSEIKRERPASHALRTRFIVGGVAAAVITAVILLLVLGGKAGAPELVGLSLDAAKESAASVGLKVEVTQQVTTLLQDPNTVTDQDPEPGQKSPDNTVRLTVTREPVPVNISRLADYDPEGDQEENPELLGRMIDGKSDTAWSSESYGDPEFGTNKSGVGVEFELESPALILRIDSLRPGWRGELFIKTLDGKMTPVAGLEGLESQVIELESTFQNGRIWFTRLTENDESRFQVDISQLLVYR